MTEGNFHQWSLVGIVKKCEGLLRTKRENQFFLGLIFGCVFLKNSDFELRFP